MGPAHFLAYVERDEIVGNYHYCNDKRSTIDYRLQAQQKQRSLFEPVSATV